MKLPTTTTLEQLAFPFRDEDPRRMMPTEFIGAAVFSALNRSAKDPLHNSKLTEIVQMNGYRLLHKGRILTQAHADVWLSIIEFFRRNGTAPGGGLEFRSGELLRILGKQNNTKSRADLHEWITDMGTCAVQIFQPGQRRAFFGPLVFGDLPKVGDGTPYRVLLHPDVCKAFARGYTGIRWVNRKALGKNELALWLHHYVSAFTEPTALGELQQLSWQKSAKPKEFKHRLVVALKLMEELGIITAWAIDADRRLSVELPSARLTRRFDSGALPE
jgi:hypothetical protein